jgi:putative membrane protein
VGGAQTVADLHDPGGANPGDGRPPDQRTGLAEERTELAEERTGLAEQRTAMAAERTLMAWVRTALAMIAFGFTIYRFLLVFAYEAPGAADEVTATRAVSLVLMGLGVLAAVAGLLEYRSTRRSLELPRRTYAVVIGVLVGVFGTVLFVDTLLHSGVR